LQVIIFGKETQERCKRGHFEGEGKRTPSLLNLPPTKREDDAISGAEDYDLKYAIKKAGPFLTQPFFGYD
jgi:hypothetical protein